MRPRPEYPARTLRFPEDRAVGEVRVIGADGSPQDAVPAQGEMKVPDGLAAAYFGQTVDPSDLAGASGLSHVFIEGEIDLGFADVLTTFPMLRQVRAGTRGLTVEGALKIVSAPHLAGVDLHVGDETNGGSEIVEAVAGIDDVDIALTVGPEAIGLICELFSAGRMSPTIEIDVDGADERMLLPLRKLRPQQELNGVRYSPKALERLEASFGSAD